MGSSPIIFCFNPRVLAGGRDPGDLRLKIIDDVSIHASSREDATPGHRRAAERGHVSIHASSREDATGSDGKYVRLSAFQSTRPRGRTRRRPNLIL